MDLRKKITLIGITQLIVVAGILLALYAREARAKVQQQYVEKARAVILTAESTREEMGRKWDQEIFTAEQLRGWNDKKELAKVISAVPVVTAWRAAMNRAKEGGYEFRVPKFSPRNPQNEPDEVEARVLRMFETEGINEHYEIDPKINSIRYFRPIRLTRECLLCHGDPATSYELWGNNEGLDPTGVKMENWKDGEVHGAFEVVQKLDAADAQIAASLHQAYWLIGGLVVLGAGVFYVLANHGINGLYRPIRNIARALNEGADQVADASLQLASSSQSLAANAGQQASALEESSAALEEMSAITTANADNAVKANTISKQTREAADAGSIVVNQLNTAMQGISEAGNQIHRIIKVIEEIAFQTNLLALNAAVEAARAGEHGKGFAVVADEVRNLAQRAGTAASEIGELITNSTERGREGVKIATSVSESLEGILQNVGAVAGLIDNIATASREQSLGVSQINAAVNQMDGATQQNASMAEQSASASEQLSAQAANVKEMVVQLLGLVGASAKTRQSMSSQTPHPLVSRSAAPAPAPARSRPAATPSVAKAKPAASGKTVPAPARSAPRPSKNADFMPLDNDRDLESF